MKTRDIGEDLTKEGSARVTIFETANIVHSYTLECGYHTYAQLNPIERVHPTISGYDFYDQVEN